jgi:hypothetical protein
MQIIIHYIVELLLQKVNEHLSASVCYSSEPNEYGNSAVVIRPSGFFDTENYGKKSSLPTLPLKKVDDVEFLFGDEIVERRDGRLIVGVDIIASTFFFIARYEEWVDEECSDLHNRFIGKKSLQFRAGLINRPIVDEYGVLLRKWLREAGLEVKEPPIEFSKIYLTHDVDVLTQYRHLRGFLGGISRGKIINIINSLSDINKDEVFTFDWLIRQDLKVENAEKIFFVKSVKKGKGYDYPRYRLESKDFNVLKNLLYKNDCKIGFHSGYYTYGNQQEFDNQVEELNKSLSKYVCYNRHHFLRISPPNMPNFFTESGITDDFSIAFADIAGFRLGTCRKVQWINPETLRLECVFLHPLTLMDNTLSNTNYMGLDYEQALATAKTLILQTKKFGGEIVTLWHNTSINTKLYHKKLYKEIISYINFLKA